MTRRGVLAVLASPAVWGQARTRPESIEFDLSLLDEWLTPSDLFFVREHFPAPAVSLSGWKLLVGGEVESPFEIAYDDLLGQGRRTLAATLECAENPAGGGLVSTAEWTGIPLGRLLARARPRGNPRFARLAGADGFTRTIPLAKAAHPDTLLAWSMNGDKLPGSHGFPLRVLVPGWYGMDSVKWLRSVELTEREDPSEAYRRRFRSLLAGVRVGEPVQAVQVKSVFSRPVEGAILTGRRFVLRGAAWAGENAVAGVETSTDGGKTWEPARLAPSKPYAWTLWEREWKIPGPGDYTLMVRARDSAGREQPAERPADRFDDYEANHWQAIRVVVR